MVVHQRSMGDNRRRRRYLIQLLGLGLLPGGFATPAFAQSQTVGGLSQTDQGIGVALVMVLVSFVMLFSLNDYTNRTASVIIDDPLSTIIMGVTVTAVLLIPYATLVAVSAVLGSLDAVAVALLTVLAAPLVFFLLFAVAVGFIAAGKSVHRNRLVVLVAVAVVSGAIGAFPIPLLAIGIAVMMLGAGAIYWDIRYGESKLESDERESYSQQHRFL